MSTPSNVWFITGASQSTGLGSEIALSALARGDKVIFAVRSHSEHLQRLHDSHPDASSILNMNVADDFPMIFAKAREAISVWGKIDVVVNNAGDYYWGNIEELKGDGFQEVYKTNVFGMINVANAFLPHMRTRRSGTLVFIGSRSAWRALPTSSTYASSKAAMHAVADIYAEELKAFNIRVLNVIPGALRTGALNRIHYPQSNMLPYEMEHGKYIWKQVPEYAHTSAEIAKFVDKSNGREPGDPRKAAKIITDVVRGEGVAEGRAWPGTLYLGSDGERQIRDKLAEILQTLDEWSDITNSVACD